VNRKRLASLLRLRRLQEDQAAGGLASAAAEVDAASAATSARVDALAGAAAPLEADGPAWMAALAARAALGSALVEARQLETLAVERRSEAHALWVEARRRTRAVELLDERAAASEVLEAQRAEQIVLDEHASRVAALPPEGEAP
jgi:flagellar FliJ protein